MSRREEFERSFTIAKSAVDQIGKNQHPAYPKTYEVWYTHLTASNKELSNAIEDIYQKYGRVSAGQIVHLHETYIANNEVADKVNSVSEEIGKQADDLDVVIQKSKTLSEDFSSSLKQATEDLKIELDQQTLEKLIKRVSHETLAVERQNLALLDELNATKQGVEKLQKNLKIIREESLMDQLTMIGNRRHFDRSFAKCIADCQKTAEPLCLIITDIDYFKKFNDKWGHQTGDQILRLVAMAIKGNVKMIDVPCRYGGEEFAIILPKTTLEKGKLVADRIRQVVANRDVVKKSTGENLGRITISAGVAALNINETPEMLLKRADIALYAAKDAGRNCVMTEQDVPSEKVA